VVPRPVGAAPASDGSAYGAAARASIGSRLALQFVGSIVLTDGRGLPTFSQRLPATLCLGVPLWAAHPGGHGLRRSVALALMLIVVLSLAFATPVCADRPVVTTVPYQTAPWVFAPGAFCNDVQVTVAIFGDIPRLAGTTTPAVR
jgi:hypothetical protein